MSFDILFQSCRFGTSPVEKTNPFTGKTELVPSNETLTSSELKAVQNMLKRAKGLGPGEHGCCVLDFSDGGSAEIFAGDLQDGCMVAVRGITSDLLRFLFDLLKAGQWVMLPVMEDSAAITSSASSAKNLPADFPKLVVCGSADELGILLSKGVTAWTKYRDQIVGEGE